MQSENRRSRSYTTSKQKTIDLLEARTRAVADRINARDFEMTSQTWSNSADSVVCTQVNGKQHHLPDALALLKQEIREAPDYHLNFLDMNTTVNNTVDRGEVFVRAEVTGNPPGVVKKGMFTFEYRLLEGCWKCVKQTTFAAGELVEWG